MMRRPRIGVTARLAPAHRSARPPTGTLGAVLHERILWFLAEAGAEPVVVTESGADALGELDGLVIPGGSDVEPARYAQEPHPHVYGVNPAQDALDFGAATAALARGIPVLGICRGLQVLNVLRGGTLIQHLDEAGGAHRRADWAAARSLDELFVEHAVRLAPGSRLAARHGTELTVLAVHHQAVDVLGSGLHAVGWAADCTIEAVEDGSGQVLGVQWHPEGRDTGDGIFAHFTEIACGYRAP